VGMALFEPSATPRRARHTSDPAAAPSCLGGLQSSMTGWLSTSMRLCSRVFRPARSGPSQSTDPSSSIVQGEPGVWSAL
jgi:hypothetical protein